ncbi:Sel1 domain-containing protein [Pseudomonas sp. M47T1]|uniref:tetratricopeptide repeat protein n=1 Tax=unclassified Pseudomonas TaxID=196821 RepID=UPI0002606817|nr:sel1 repeat family protein [Pseudomonas sp. M47T1]EIK95147.1 Sel1 domain-containing protein [Pseudomonas sp. M47T1]
MGFELRREEILDAERLSALLKDNPASAAQAILTAAGAGLADAQALLGQILLDGQGIERDPSLARTWFGIAADGGHPMARNMLGRCHEHGWGGPQDVEQAAVHYREAAAAGLDWGLYNYANLLGTGRGVPLDHELALACYRRAADMGHAKSMNLLGRYLENGMACEVDAAQGHDWYRRSAQAGDFRGQFSHAAVLAEAGRVDEALHWLQVALDGGNLNFLRVSGPALLQATDPRIRAMAAQYAAKAQTL